VTFEQSLVALREQRTERLAFTCGWRGNLADGFKEIRVSQNPERILGSYL
jgi:hypothetical protein